MQSNKKEDEDSRSGRHRGRVHKRALTTHPAASATRPSGPRTPVQEEEIKKNGILILLDTKLSLGNLLLVT